MKTMRKRALALFMAVLMVVNLIGVPVYAADESTDPVLSCTVAEHIHADDCYEKVLNCDKADSMELACGKEVHAHSEACTHEHSEACYEVTCTTEQDLICTAEEKTLKCEAVEKTLNCSIEEKALACEEEHEHTEDCYAIHEHGEDCYDVHEHTDACYDIHAHGEGCYAAHVHNSECAKQLICGLDCSKEEHAHSETCYAEHVHDDDCYVSELKCEVEEHVHSDACYVAVVVEEVEEDEDLTVVLDEENKTLTLDGAELTEGITVPDGYTVIVKSDSSIAAGDATAITGEGVLTIEGPGKLTLTGANGIYASSVVINDMDVDFSASSCGIQVYNETGDATVELNNVDGNISGGYAGIYVNGECEGEASVSIDKSDLEVTSTATSWNNRARKSAITVYVSQTEKVESSININDSKVIAKGSDAGLSINNYLGDADATNSASSKINITNSTVVANGTNGTWSGIFASVLGQHPDADSIITITDSSVYAVSPNTGILTSSQAGESKIILNNSVLGASGKTALSMIEPKSQAQVAELNNGSTYIQMTPAAVMKGEISVFSGKTIIATAGDGITYNEDNNYYVIPQGSAVTETFTDGTVNEYTFNNQAGGVGGFSYAKEEIWGFDVPEKWETGDIIIYTPEELIEFATMTQDGTLGDCTDRVVKLGNDIDMTGYDWYYRNAEGTIVTDHRIPEFSGIFDGQGYAIKNMSYRDEYAAATDAMPLAFILTANGTFKDLTVDGITVDTVAPARFGGLADALTYSGDGTTTGCTIKNVVVDADAQLAFGGFAFKILDVAEVSDCHVENFTVNANSVLNGPNSGRCGGFVATGGEVTPFVNCSVKNFELNAKSTGTYVGGFIGGASMTASYTNCDVAGFEMNAAGKFSAVGGFAGYTAGSAWGAGLVFTDCDVTGLDIVTTDKISVGAGGFIGNLYGQGKTVEDGAHHFINCSAEGSISGDAYAGGFAGWLYGRSNGCVANFENCSAAVNISNNDYYGAGFVGNFVPSGTNKMTAVYTNCTASGDVFAKEPVGSFVDADSANVDGIIGGTYNYDPENVDSATGETNNVAPGYRALDNGDGTWTVFPDNGKEVVKVAFHRWNDEQNGYENWRTVEVFKDVDFFEDAYDNALNYSHPDYRFANGIGELDEEADDATARTFSYWTDAPDGTELVLDNEIEVLTDMDVYAAYVDYVCYIQETGVYYQTLTAAVAEANKLARDNVIVMIKDIDFDSTKALAVTGNLTIISEPEHEEAHIISRGDYTGTMFSINKGISLTLDGGIVIDGDNNWVMDKALYNQHLTTMSREGISIYTTEYSKEYFTAYNTEKAGQYFTPEEGAPIATAYMITVGNNATLNLKNVTIQNNYTPKSGLVNTSAGATVNLEGAQIKHCASIEGSGTVVNASGKITVNVKDGTLIDGNHVGGNHGLFRVYSGAVVNMSGGTISNTTGWNSNGIVIGMYGTGSTFNMSGGLITANSSVFGADNGRNAAVYLHANSTMNMTGGTISHNNGRARGGIDTYKESSTLNINRADQYFVDGVYPEESGKAAYVASNHPMVIDNYSRYENYNYDVGTSSGNYEHWWITGGIYTQDVDEYCAEGYICIPYDDTERTDDFIVVPGYRVKYISVETVETTNEETGEVTTEIKETLEKKYFHMLPRDKFWYEMDERANTFTVSDERGVIDTWYTEKELTNVYDFEGTKLEGNLNVYGQFKSMIVAYDYNGGLEGDLTKSQVSTTEKTYNPSLAGVPAPVRAGYELAGWKYAVEVDPESTDMSDNGKWYMGETLTESTRFIAQWVALPGEAPDDEPPVDIDLGTKTDELIDRKTNRFEVTIDVPGADGNKGHDEVILMVDGSYSMDNEWPAMKEAIVTIGKSVLNGSGTTQLTLMAFGMGDNIVLEHVKDVDTLAAALGALPGNLLYGRSSTNCEAGFDGVANYIKNHDNTLNKVQVVFISDGNINTDETPRAFAQNWKTWTKFGALAVAQEALYGTLNNGKNLPAAINTVFGDKYGTTAAELLAHAGSMTEEEFLAFADQVWEDVYVYSNLHIGAKYPVSVAERAFVKYDKEMGTYIQDLFYYTTYKSAYVGYGDRWARTPVAANELAAMDEVSAMYVVDYDGYTAWMDTGITNEKSTFVQSNGIAGLVTALQGALGEMAKAPFNDVVVTDYMSKWVNLDQDTIKIVDVNTDTVIWTIKDGWLVADELKTTAKNPPVVVELVDPADYAAGGDDVIGNTNGDIYKLTWYVKDGAMLRSDNYQLRYEVTVDTKEEGFQVETDYPANGTTRVDYIDEEGQPDGNDIDVPDVDALGTIVNIQKVDENGNAMTGAEFEVFSVENGVKTSIGTFAVDANGQYELLLNPGDHLLVETKAPSGYLTAADPIEITVSDSLEVNVTETKAASYDDETLTVVNRPPHAAVVLTVDMSGTMYRNKMGGKRYVDVAKAKALEFVNEYAASAEHNGKRMLAVTAFDTDAKVVLNWIDVSTSAGLASARAAINAMKVVDNGKASSNYVCTNFDAGIILSRNLLKQSAVSEVDRCFAVILSDGAPTVTVNSDTDTVGTIKSSFWGNQLDMNGKKYQNKHCGGGWTHPGEVDRTLKYLATGSNNLADLTCTYKDASGDEKEGIFIIGVGGLMNFKLFNDAVYGTSNGTRTSDVKKKPAAFNHIEALQGYTQAQILKLTTGDWMQILADKSGGVYESATNATALANEFDAIMTAVKNTTATS